MSGTEKHGQNRQSILGVVFVFLRCFYGTYFQIVGLKARGDYLDQFWFNKISVLLFERPKPPKFIISGFLSPRELSFVEFSAPVFSQIVNNFDFPKRWFVNIIFLKNVLKILSIFSGILVSPKIGFRPSNFLDFPLINFGLIESLFSYVMDGKI